MKGLPVIVFGLLFLQSCEKFSLNNIYRSDVLWGRNQGRDSLSGRDHTLKSDTTVCVSAVVVPEDYDWRRDTAYGAVACEVQLLKNGVRQFSARAGADEPISISPSTHHIFGGHLYTERATESGTIICRDGELCFSYPERELLKGLLIKNGIVHTVGRTLDGSGFNYRRNGEIVISQENALVFGDFVNPAYGRSGAIYENDGAVCFCFRNSSTCYTVRDGEMLAMRPGIRAARVRDMRLIGSECYYVADFTTSMFVFSPSRTYTLPTGISWQTASVFSRDGIPWIMADSPTKTICRPLEQAEKEDAGMQFSGNGNFVYPGGSRVYSVSCDGSIISLRDDNGELLFIRDSTFFFGPLCAQCAADQMYMLVNPRECGELPFIWQGDKEIPCDLHGYLTGIEVEISPPR